ncbi:Hypothetical protein ABZS17G119_04273 (plasmid) [Kosakonia cowanii]
MNSFWLLRTAVDNKDKMKAMLILRDKPESVARKILEKSGASVPPYKGKAFWQWAQNYIIRACRPDSSRDKYHAHTECEITGITGTGQGRTERKPRSGGLAESARPAGHAGRSHEHTAAATPATGAVCAGTDGLSPVCAHLGAERPSQSAPAPDAGKQDVVVGNRHATGLFLRLCRARAVVCPQHSVCVRRRDPAAGVDSPLPGARPGCRSGVAGPDGLAAVFRQLRSVRAGSGSLAGNLPSFTTGTPVRGSCPVGDYRASGDQQSACHTGTGSGGNTVHPAHVSSADSRCRSGPHNDRRPRTSIHAGNVLLHGLCRSSLYSWADNPAMLALDAELNVRMRRVITGTTGMF